MDDDGFLAVGRVDGLERALKNLMDEEEKSDM